MSWWQETYLHVWKDTWAIIGIAITVIIVIEIGVPGIKIISRWLRGKSIAPVDYRSNADFYRNKNWAKELFAQYQREAKVTWAPYVQWWSHPMSSTYFNVNSNGIRKTIGNVSAEEVAGSVRIWAFGGSTLLGIGSRDEMTIPSILARKLNDLDKNVEITNFGQPGHSMTQELISLVQALKQDTKPDIVLFYDGLNEVIPAEQFARADRMFNEHNRKDEFNILHFSRRRELILEGIKAMIPRTLRRIREIGLAFSIVKPQAKVYTLLAEDEIEPLSQKVVNQYIDNIRVINGMAKEWGFQALYFWQPSLVSKKSLTLHEESYQYEGTAEPQLRRPFFSAVYQKRRSDPFFATRNNTIDISYVLDDITDGCYIDPFHVSENANEIIAGAIFPYLKLTVEETKK